jgi:hypothetical protein
MCVDFAFFLLTVAAATICTLFNCNDTEFHNHLENCVCVLGCVFHELQNFTSLIDIRKTFKTKNYALNYFKLLSILLNVPV